MKITWLGHSAFRLDTAKASILIDPFLSHNPSFKGQSLVETAKGVTHILLTHGHGDHVGDTVQLAKETGATVIANADLVGWLGTKGLTNMSPGNTGGTIAMEGFTVTFVNALHSSAAITEDGVSHALGNANGLMLHFDDEPSLLHMGDTDIFSDMGLIHELHQPDRGFHIMGRAANAKEVVSNARVSLAPLRFGAGIKGKLIESMECGTPSITTSIGAEAMHGELAWNGIVKNEATDIAAAAVELYTNKTAWLEAQRNGINIINTIYANKLFSQELIKHILSLQYHLKQHRLKNFTGAMLMHHTMASTKYMSRWIEIKNATSEVR